MSKITKEIVWNNLKVKLETGEIARLAKSSVVASIDGTVVLCAICTKDIEDDSYLDTAPLSVAYQEKFYSAGKIPGGFLKREGKPSDREVLISRAIDRIFRPLIPKTFRKSVSITCTLLSYSGHKTEVISILGVSAAMIMAGIFDKPVVAGCMSHDGENFSMINEHISSQKSSSELLVAYLEDLVIMIEATLEEIRPETVSDMVQFGYKQMVPLVTLIRDFTKISEGGECCVVGSCDDSADGDCCSAEGECKDGGKRCCMVDDSHSDIDKIISSSSNIKESIYTVFNTKNFKKETDVSLAKIEKSFFNQLENSDYSNVTKGMAFEALVKSVIFDIFTSKGCRIDFRSQYQIRDITCNVDYLPKTHGSALFTRGHTQVLAVATLGNENDMQMYESVAESGKNNFMLHYNFPPFSVGEIGSQRALGRREIGHGNLANQAFHSLVMSEKLPYTIRIVADVLESDGSSSMATVCASSLAMMCAGIPLRKHVAGIAMGLFKIGDEFYELSDLNATEDKFGNMDFKVAGTTDGITTIQLDIKNIDGIPIKVVSRIFEKAFDGISDILAKMYNAISEPRVSADCKIPQVRKVKVETDKIKEIIGARGKVIKEICEKTKASVSIENDGVVTITGLDAAVDAACDMIGKIARMTFLDGSSNTKSVKSQSQDSQHKERAESTSDIKKSDEDVTELKVDDRIMPKIGEIYLGTISDVTKFGASVSFNDTIGFIHISNIADKYIKDVNLFFKVGQSVSVKVLDIDERNNRIRLSTKGIMQQGNEQLSNFESSESKKNTQSNGDAKGKVVNKTSKEARKLRFF